MPIGSATSLTLRSLSEATPHPLRGLFPTFGASGSVLSPYWAEGASRVAEVEEALDAFPPVPPTRSLSG